MVELARSNRATMFDSHAVWQNIGWVEGALFLAKNFNSFLAWEVVP